MRKNDGGRRGMKKRVRTLLRVSSRQQLHEDDIPIQRAEARQYIASRSDWIFDREYMEKAVSAYKNSPQDREVLQQILKDASAHEFEILLAYMSDRIGRQEEYSFYVAALNRQGIEVWTVRDGQLKTEEHIDKLLNYIRFWQNEGESKKTGMRVRDTQAEMVKAGKFTGGKAPYGYRLVSSGMISSHGRLLKKLERVEEEAAVIQKIYRLAVLDGMGSGKIAGILNEEGIPAVSPEGWKAGTVAGILKNPVYMGYYAINRRVNDGGLKRLDRREWIYSREQVEELVIVQKETWERAQEIREARRKNDSVPFSGRGRLALTGLVFCGYCGSPLRNGSYCNRWVTKSGEKRAAFAGRYLCPGRCRPRCSYAMEYLEGAVFYVVEHMLGLLTDEDFADEQSERKKRRKMQTEREQKNIVRKQALLLQDIAALEERLPEAIRGQYCFEEEKLARMIREKEVFVRKLQQKRELLDQKLLREERGVLDNRTEIQPDWKEVFCAAGTAAKKMLLTCMIHKIEVRDGEMKIEFKINARSGL